MKKLSLLFASLLMAACASTPKTDTTQQTIDKNTPVEADKKTAQVSMTDSEASKLTDEIEKLQSQSVYFDFDKFVVKPEYRDALNNQANFTKDQKNDIVTLQGNADERGSSEYNLALGAKRANAVKNSLKVLGVPANKILDVSFGEEKPRLSCHEEKCWQENRRVDFVHQLGK
jgi:peptidoglycan-associated lipoprotein